MQWRPLVIEQLEKQGRGNVAIEKAVPEQERVFEDAISWRSFWAGFQAEAVPEVDFTTDRVLVVSLGTKAPGWAISVVDITRNPDSRRTTVELREQRPNPAKVYPTVLIYPALAVAFPAGGAVKVTRTTTLDAA